MWTCFNEFLDHRWSWSFVWTAAAPLFQFLRLLESVLDVVADPLGCLLESLVLVTETMHLFMSQQCINLLKRRMWQWKMLADSWRSSLICLLMAAWIEAEPLLGFMVEQKGGPFQQLLLLVQRTNYDKLGCKISVSNEISSMQTMAAQN